MRIPKTALLAAGLACIIGCSGSDGGDAGSSYDFSGTWSLRFTQGTATSAPVDHGFEQNGTAISIRRGFNGPLFAGTCNPADGSFEATQQVGAGILTFRGVADGDAVTGTYGLTTPSQPGNPSTNWTETFTGARTSRSLPEPTVADAWEFGNLDWPSMSRASVQNVTGTVRNVTPSQRRLQAVTCSCFYEGSGQATLSGTASVGADVPAGAIMNFSVSIQTGKRYLRSCGCSAVE